MDCSMPGFPVYHQLLELAQTHAHRVGDAIQPSHPLSSPSPAFSLSQHHSLFQWVGSFWHWSIAYGERCRIRDLWRKRFSFGTRDQAWSLKSFCVAEFYSSEKGTEKASDTDIRRGMKSTLSPSLSKGIIYFLIGYYNKSKECLKVVKTLLDPLP